MKKYAWIVALVVLGLGLQGANAAKLYKWVDEYGNVTYRDTPPTKEGTRYEEKDISGGRAAEGASDAMNAAAEAAPVVIYRTPSCSPCDSAAAYLNSRGVPFTEKDVEGNGELQQELKAKAGQISVPTIMIGEKVMKGYMQSLLEGELDAAGYPKVEKGEAPANGQAPAGEAAEPPEETDNTQSQ